MKSILKSLCLVQNYEECVCQFMIKQKPDKFYENPKNFKHLGKTVDKLQQFYFTYSRVDLYRGQIGLIIIL